MIKRQTAGNGPDIFISLGTGMIDIHYLDYEERIEFLGIYILGNLIAPYVFSTGAIIENV